MRPFISDEQQFAEVREHAAKRRQVIFWTLQRGPYGVRPYLHLRVIK